MGRWGGRDSPHRRAMDGGPGSGPQSQGGSGEHADLPHSPSGRYKIVRMTKAGTPQKGEVDQHRRGLEPHHAKERMAQAMKDNPGLKYQIHPDETNYAKQHQVNRISRFLGQKGVGHL